MADEPAHLALESGAWHVQAEPILGAAVTVRDDVVVAENDAVRAEQAGERKKPGGPQRTVR
jgi:hypothetical protein